MSLLEDLLLGEDERKKPSLDVGELSAPDIQPPEIETPDMPVASAVPVRHSTVSDYIKSLASKPDTSADDAQELQNARIMDAINVGSAGMGRNLLAAGAENARSASAWANAISGHGFQAPEIVSGASSPAPDPQEHVKQYIARKAAGINQDAKHAETAKALADAEKAQAMTDALTDPNSIAARRVAVQEKENGRKTTQGDTKLGLDGRKVDQKDEEIGLKGDAQEETGRHNRVTEFIAGERMRLARELQGARDEQTRAKLGVQLKRLGILEERLTNEEGAGVVPLAEGQERYLKPQVADQLNDRAQAAQSVLGTLGEIKKIIHDHRVGLLAPSEAQAQLQTRFAELGPQWNAAQTKLAFSGPRGAAIQHALTDPGSLGGVVKDILSGGTYTATNLDQAEQLIRESLEHQGEARGVHFGKGFGPNTKANKPKVGTAAPGRPGSGTGPGEDGSIPDDVKALPPPPPGKMRIYNPKTHTAAVGKEGSVPAGWVRV